MMRTIMIQQHSFIIDDYVHSASQRPEFVHSAAWHTDSRHHDPLWWENIQILALSRFLSPSSQSVGR